MHTDRQRSPTILSPLPPYGIAYYCNVAQSTFPWIQAPYFPETSQKASRSATAFIGPSPGHSQKVCLQAPQFDDDPSARLDILRRLFRNYGRAHSQAPDLPPCSYACRTIVRLSVRPVNTGDFSTAYLHTSCSAHLRIVYRRGYL